MKIIDVTDVNLNLEPYQIILKPISSEKGYHLAAARNTYTFEVNPLASKLAIKEAIETLFNVKVISVSTQNRKGKVRRSKKTIGRTKTWKKAMVTLHSNDRIDIF